MITNDLFSQLRLQGVYDALADVRTQPSDLLFTSRVKEVPVTEGELTARYIGYAQIADLIADNAEALTYNMGKFTTETTTNFNMKLGMGMTQEEINALNVLMQVGNLNGPAGDVWKMYLQRNMAALRLGIEQRQEWMIAAMMLDGDFGQGNAALYSRFGFIDRSKSWGLPAGMNTTVSVGWDTAGSATPVADIFTALLNAKRRYKKLFTRATMSTAAFQYMIATTEFQTKAKPFIPPTLTFSNLQLLALDQMRTLAEATLGITIVLYDGTYATKDASGVTTFVPFLPVTKVILDTPLNDNNPAIQDFGSAPVTESIVAGLVPAQAPAIPSNVRGPVVYAALPNAQLNPPGITYWAVKRGFARKHELQANAVLTVGTFADNISLTAPF